MPRRDLPEVDPYGLELEYEPFPAPVTTDEVVDGVIRSFTAVGALKIVWHSPRGRFVVRLPQRDRKHDGTYEAMRQMYALLVAEMYVEAIKEKA